MFWNNKYPYTDFSQLNIDALARIVGKCDKSVKDLKSDMSTAKVNITALRRDMTDAQDDIEDLQDDMEQAKNDIDDIEERLNVFITPQMFGAAGDGTTDDTQAFIDMFDSGETEIFIPPGIYRITDDIEITTNYINIFGAGMYNSVLEMNGHSFTINAYDYTLNDMRIAHASVVETKKHHGIIKNCWFYSNTVGLKMTDSFITQVDSCIISFNTIGVVLDNQSFETILLNCVIDNNNRCGIIVTGNSSGPVIKNCTIEGNYNRDDGHGCGICVNHYAGNVNVESCWFETNGTTDYSADIFYAGNGYNTSRLTTLFNAINTDYTLMAASSAICFGRMLFSGNTFTFTKYAVAVAGYGSITNIKDNTFKGTLNKNNVPVLIAGSTILTNRVFCDHNSVINPVDAAITAEMLSGVNGTYIYTDLSGFTAAQEKSLSTIEYISIDGQPLYSFPRTVKRIDVDNITNSTAYDLAIPIYVNSAFLYFTYDTCTLISCNNAVTSAPTRSLYGTAPTVTLDSVNKIMHIAVPAYRAATILVAQ